MSIFSGIKDRLFRRGGDDFSDIRSHVLGEPAIPESEMPSTKYDAPFKDTAEPGLEPFEVDKVPERKPLGFDDYTPEPPRQETRDYDILDRLNMIEAQLSAIRSQTETINERLKNMEVRLGGRRY
jgi:hypothetical protein